MTAGTAGHWLLITGLAGVALTLLGYGLSLRRPADNRGKLGRLGYALAALGVVGTFGVLAGIVYNRQYQYIYAFEHTGNALHGWYRLAATWSAQEGSFLLWGFWTSLIGFLVIARAGRYEARVMPFFVTILGFLCLILLKQSPFQLIPAPTAADYALNPGLHYPPVMGQGLNPSLVNYWMTIHPPTIFFGFASLAVPFCYAIAALIWRDYDEWTPRVMPYALLSCATLGIGLFMGGYWAYETLGWHGFWAWDPVENASFFPWLAVTALVHGLVVQRTRGGMARTNTFLGILAFWLFLLGTFLTRSGALSGKDANGQMLSVHAFDNIAKSSHILMVAMMVAYGAMGLGLWLLRLRSMPTRKTTGDSALSRDMAFFLAVTLMIAACAVVTLGTTTPLIQGWLHKPLAAPKPAFYNKAMMPLTVLTALLLGCVPWLAWRRTNPETFRRKLTWPWIGMLVFGFSMVLWVGAAQRAQYAVVDTGSTDFQETMRAWVSPTVQRIAVVSLASVGFLAALSNAILAYRVFRKKPFNAGGWIAHVGIGLLIVGVIVSNTYERTTRITLEEGQGSKGAFGYQFQFERMTGTPPPARPINPDYDRTNAIELRVTPPGSADAGDSGGPRTYLTDIKWFVHNLDTAPTEESLEHMRWPAINKSIGHDLYVSLADDPGFGLVSVTLQEGQKTDIGPYRVGYMKGIAEPTKRMMAEVGILTPDGRAIPAFPEKLFERGPEGMSLVDSNIAIPDLKDENGVPAVVYLKRLDPATHAATLLFNLPQYRGRWEIPLEITYKPWINLVWTGVLVATAGTLLAMVRRIREERAGTAAETDDEEASDVAPTPEKRTPAAAMKATGGKRRRTVSG